MEHTKLKLQARLAECESTVENVGSKLENLEKSKAKLQADIEDLGAYVDAASTKANQMEKRIKQFDRIIGDWKRKADGLSQELDNSQKECRNVSSELFRVRSGYEEASVQLADVKRENGTLGDEIKDIINSIPSYKFEEAADGYESAMSMAQKSSKKSTANSKGASAAAS